jgi:O-antigen/teichoic acid export membrane protein
MFILKFERPQWRDVSNALMQGWATFVLKGSISLYTLFIPLTLGWLAGPTALAQFNLADKLRVASQSLLTPISQAIFPRLSHLFSNEPGRARAFLSKITLWFLVIGFFLSLGMFFAAELLVAIFGGSEFEQSVGLLRIMSFCPLLVAVSNIYGAQVLLAAGKQKVVVLTTILCAGSVLLVTGSVVTSFGGQGAASIVVVVEAIVAVVYLIAGKKLLYRSQIA